VNSVDKSDAERRQIAAMYPTTGPANFRTTPCRAPQIPLVGSATDTAIINLVSRPFRDQWRDHWLDHWSVFGRPAYRAVTAQIGSGEKCRLCRRAPSLRLSFVIMSLATVATVPPNNDNKIKSRRLTWLSPREPQDHDKSEPLI